MILCHFSSGCAWRRYVLSYPAISRGSEVIHALPNIRGLNRSICSFDF
jgi:hypothetical protein